MSKDGWDEREPDEEEKLMQRPGFVQWIDEEEGADKAEHTRGGVDWNDVKPDAFVGAFPSAQGEVDGEEDHRDEADDVAEEVGFTDVEVCAEEDDGPDEGKEGSDDLEAVHPFFNQDEEDEGHYNRSEVDDEGGVGRVRHTSRHEPCHKVQAKEESGPDR